jgi:UPF0755 protein
MAKAKSVKPAVTKKKPARNKGRSPWGLMGKALIAVLIFAVISGGMVAGGIYLHYQAYLTTPVLAEGDTRTVVIPANSAWPQVVRILEEARLVRRPLYFEYWSREVGLPSSVRAGTFQLQGPLMLEDLAAALRRGGLAEDLSVTIPEGFTIFHIADRLESLGLVSREEFLRAATNEEALAEAGIDAESFEGYLFPDTYRFRQGTSAQAIIERKHRRWKEVWAQLYEAHLDGFEHLSSRYEFGVHEIVTMASLIERETGAGAERDLIARVFYNRLDRNMKLQTDPTCVYGEETYMLVPRPEHCRDPLNRYSTYVIEGLTPGPIANPGRASLEAALAPSTSAEAMEYLFFVSRRDGTHHFTRTYQEHREAIRRFLK